MGVKKSMNSFWIGTEVEGRFKGLKTLFVVGDQPYNKILLKLIENPSIHHIYFGAGNQSKVTDYNIMKAMAEVYTITYEVTAEDYYNTVPIDIIKNKNIHLIVTLKANGLNNLKETDTLKIEDENNVFTVIKECTQKTNKQIDYEGDIVV